MRRLTRVFACLRDSCVQQHGPIVFTSGGGGKPSTTAATWVYIYLKKKHRRKSSFFFFGRLKTRGVGVYCIPKTRTRYNIVTLEETKKNCANCFELARNLHRSDLGGGVYRCFFFFLSFFRVLLGVF